MNVQQAMLRLLPHMARPASAQPSKCALQQRRSGGESCLGKGLHAQLRALMHPLSLHGSVHRSETASRQRRRANKRGSSPGPKLAGKAEAAHSCAFGN